MRMHVWVVMGVLLGSASGLLAIPPEAVWFYDGLHRYIRLNVESFGKVHLQLRTTGQPGEASYWLADGQKGDKEFDFSRTVGEEESRGTEYIATGGDASFKVKIKPGQDKEKAQDEGIAGLYHRLTEDRRLSLAKKEFEGAEKRLAEVEKASLKSWQARDKPALQEWKLRWPALRDRILALRDKPKPPGEQKPKPLTLGPPGETPPEKQPDRWFAVTELTGSAIGFLGTPIDPKTKVGWDGDYNDGFGGTVNLIFDKKEGKVRFSFNCSRGSDDFAQTGQVSGDVSPSGDEAAEFADTNAEVKDPAQQAHITLHRIGQYLIVHATHIDKYTTRGWFDGVYRKQPPNADP